MTAENIIEVKNLSKSFKENKVLNDISFNVKKGDIYGFFGRNGAGKTTTIRIILDLLNKDKGTVRVFGEDYGLSKKARKLTGVLLENNGTYEMMSAYENLRYYAKLYDLKNYEQKIQEVLKLVDLENKKNVLIAKFSTGMKKKIGLARALLHNPKLLILDEPTTGLDPEAQMDFRELIKKLSKENQITVMINTHNLDEAQKICNKIAILHEGKIKLEGELSKILKDNKTDSLEKIYLKTVRGEDK